MTKKKRFYSAGKQMEWYQHLYGGVPDDYDDRLAYLSKVRSPARVQSEVSTVVKDRLRIRKHRLNLTWYTEPHPSQRPRTTSVGGFSRIYVPLASITKEEFKLFIQATLPGFKPISTPMRISIRCYLKTPSGVSSAKRLLAEMGIWRPWGRSADADNLLKTYTDCMIGTLIEDDSLADAMSTEKFYSVKPRVEIQVTYDSRFPVTLSPEGR